LKRSKNGLFCEYSLKPPAIRAIKYFDEWITEYSGRSRQGIRSL